jgi:hypothetical protein
MGWITQNTLRESGVQQEVMANVMAAMRVEGFIVR